MVLWLILALVLLLLAVLVYRGMRAGIQDPAPTTVIPEKVDREKAIAGMQTLIRFPTVTGPEQEEAFNGLKAALAELFPNIYRTCSLYTPSDRSLIYHWKGKKSDSPAVLMAHFDVVPAPDEGWMHPPFSGDLADGAIWGRGTLDTKSTLFSSMQACEQLMAEGFVPQQDIWLCYSGTEETGGYGAPANVEFLQSRGVHPAIVLDEGGAVVEKVFPGLTRPCAVVGTAEKGSMIVRMTVQHHSGHASTPPAESAMGVLAKALLRVESHPFPYRLSTAANQTFQALSGHSSLPLRIVFANLWLFRPLVSKVSAKLGGELNALGRTTVAFTQMQGSDASNVMPDAPWISTNIRVNTGETMETVIDYVKKVVHDDRVQVEATYGRNPSKESRADGEGWEKLKNAIAGTWPDAFLSPYLMLAGSDSYFYDALCDHVYRFCPMKLSREERAMIHGKNERIPVDTLITCIQFYIRLVRSL